MSDKYRYWNIKAEEDNCKISLKETEDIEDKIAKVREKLDNVSKERDAAKDKRDKATEEERTNYRYQYYAKDNEFVAVKAELCQLEEHYKIKKRNCGLELKIQRLKDMYSRKESIGVIILYNGIEDAQIASTVSKINEDIYKLEEYGIYLTPPYCDELATIIRDKYFDIKATERQFIDNDIPKETIISYLKMCCEELVECGQQYIDKNNEYYNIPVKEFKKWYDTSAYRKFTLTSIKEALIIHGYAKGNKGRNERTVANVGKVVSLRKAELELWLTELEEAKKNEK